MQDTKLFFHYDGNLHKTQCQITAVKSVRSLQETDTALLKVKDDDQREYFAVFTDRTIFHPQGGGQPSDGGIMSTEERKFNVTSARMGSDPSTEGQVLHFGYFDPGPNEAGGENFQSGQTVDQEIDVEKRNLYSRYHTAGHVLGTAVRQLLGSKVPGFDELKASHFPNSAACEFKGLIGGEHKDSIQARVDELVAADLPVEIDWWDEEDFKREGLERLIPESKGQGGPKLRVVKIVGAEVYPCGGTHVLSTAGCGKTVVKKIGRSKGVSRVSYQLADG